MALKKKIWAVIVFKRYAKINKNTKILGKQKHIILKINIIAKLISV